MKITTRKKCHPKFCCPEISFINIWSVALILSLGTVWAIAETQTQLVDGTRSPCTSDFWFLFSSIETRGLGKLLGKEFKGFLSGIQICPM